MVELNDIFASVNLHDFRSRIDYDVVNIAFQVSDFKKLDYFFSKEQIMRQYKALLEGIV